MNDGEGAKAAVGASCDAKAAAGCKTGGLRNVGAGQARNISEEDSGDQRKSRPNPEHTRVHREIQSADGEARGVAGEDLKQGPRDHYAKRGSGAAEYQAFSEQGPAKGATASAESRANGQLAFAAHGTGKDEVGRVGASNDENEPGGGEKNDKHGASARSDLIAEEPRFNLEIAVGGVSLVMIFLHRGIDRLQLGAGLFERGAGSEAAEEFGHAMDAAGNHSGVKVVRAHHDIGHNRCVRKPPVLSF